MSVSSAALLTGLQVPLTGAVRSAITGGEIRELSATELVGSGFIGGALSGVVCAPLELVLIQQQRFGTKLLATPAAVVAQTGWRGLFRGFWTSCGREGIFTAGIMGGSVKAGQAARESFPQLPSRVSSVLGGIACGAVAATLSHPLDTIKSCMQGDVAEERYGSLTATTRRLLAEPGGPLVFFRGWGFRTLRMSIAICVIGELRYTLAPLFFPGHFEEYLGLS